MDGFQPALIAGAAVLLLAAVLAYVFIPSGGHPREDTEDEALEQVVVEV
jgi:hypothetical protein